MLDVDVQSDLQFSKKKKEAGISMETGKQEDMYCCHIILFPLLSRGQPFFPKCLSSLATEKKKTSELGGSF